MAGDIVRKWPEWPEGEIAEWLEIGEGVAVRYRLVEFNSARVIWIHRATGSDSTGDEYALALPWPDYPRRELAAYLGLEANTPVVYGPSTGRLVGMVKQDDEEARQGVWDSVADKTIGLDWRGQLAGDPTTTNEIECAGCGYQNTIDGQVQGRLKCQNPEPPTHKLHDKPASD